MVSHTETRQLRETRPRLQRNDRFRVLGFLSIGWGALSLILLFGEPSRTLAWLCALPAVAIAVFALSSGNGRKRYAVAGFVLGWIVFSFSFAMMLWG